MLRNDKRRRAQQASRHTWSYGLLASAPRAPPVLVIDELHALQSERERLAMAKFLRFALFLTDEAICHVLLVTRPWAAHELDLLNVFTSRRRWRCSVRRPAARGARQRAVEFAARHTLLAVDSTHLRNTPGRGLTVAVGPTSRQ